MQSQRGFSLLELLVALFVVVLITSMVSLSVSSGGQEIELESRVRSLAAIAEYAIDEAQMEGMDYGLLLLVREVDGDQLPGFAWRQRRPEGWRRPDSISDVFLAQDFPSFVELDLELENVQVSELFTEENLMEATPQVIFYSSGETSVGAMTLREQSSGDVLWRLEWDLLGRFKVLRRGEPDEEEDEGGRGA